jgi:L-ascorbate metabolism protein UlaG (beta-lactamase superfamily)
MEEDRDRLLERLKALDLAHRNRLEPHGGAKVVSLRFVRTFVRHLLAPVKVIDAAPVARPAAGLVAVTFVGHATCQLTTTAARVLTDPLLGTSLRGLRRATAAALHAEDLADTTLVLISHAHADHLDHASLARIPTSAHLAVPVGCGPLVQRHGFDTVTELSPGDRLRHGDLEILAVPARHDGRRGVSSAYRGANGYVLQGPDVAVYFAGDTGYFSGFSEIGRLFQPDVALLPIAGYQPYPLRETHMSPMDALQALEDLRARLMVPIAFGSFPLGYEPFDEPAAWLTTLAAERGLSDRVARLEHGQTLSVRRRPG